VLAGLLLALQTIQPLAVADDPVRSGQDVLHYSLALSLGDPSGNIEAQATVRAVLLSGGFLVLDFDDALTVDSVVGRAGRISRVEPQRRGGVPGWELRLEAGKWVLAIPARGAPGDTLEVSIFYRGRPRDGLVARANRYGAPTVFADNWPDRAHFWFPCNDHPSDKATAAFAIEVPAGWRAVANGHFEGSDTLAGGRSRWRWRTSRPIPTYTMVVGAGRLSVTALAGSGEVPQSVWTFPEDSAFAVEGPFRRAPSMVSAYARLIGPFPYAKLAHVESSTRFGGMENSSAIFYAEEPYVRRTMDEEVVAHETAHQWFGDAVTPRDWHHLWLSEGLASYFGPLVFSLIGEPERFRQAMERHRRVYFASAVVDRPVIDTAEKNLTRLLNENNYPKAAWVLHMLRQEVGDSVFFGGLRAYYGAFRDSTALSADLAAIWERAAGRPLGWFFEQWLLQPGYPKLELSWGYEAGELVLEVAQRQPTAWGRFRLRLPVRLEFPGGEVEWLDLPVEARERTLVRRPVREAPSRVVADPEGELLAELAVRAR
jgi:aminopeptidase N